MQSRPVRMQEVLPRGLCDWRSGCSLGPLSELAATNWRVDCLTVMALSIALLRLWKCLSITMVTSSVALLTTRAAQPEPMPGVSTHHSYLYVHFIALNNPAQCLATARVRLRKRFSVRTPGNGALLSGRIQSHGGMLLGNFQGQYELSTSFFDGEVQLEKSVMPRALAFSGFLNLTYFVVSTNCDAQVTDPHGCSVLLRSWAWPGSRSSPAQRHSG
jgi:hypothetical protein